VQHIIFFNVFLYQYQVTDLENDFFISCILEEENGELSSSSWYICSCFRFITFVLFTIILCLMLCDYTVVVSHALYSSSSDPLSSSAFCNHSINGRIFSKKCILPFGECASRYHLKTGSSEIISIL